MAPIVLEGATLGKKHQRYNQLLKDVISSKVQPAKIDYSKTDIENLFNIDVASSNRNLEYILDVLKGQDMLYVSRAIKQSTWLITDARYAHIIDPEYLHTQLFPQMMPTASSKLLLHVRLTLKEESRAEKFFIFFKDKDLKTAIKWLPNCSINFIGDVVEKHPVEITTDIFGRLCRRSPKILEIYVKATQNIYYRVEHLKAAMFLINNYTDLYLDALDNEKHDIPKFSKKHTDIVMRKCPQRIMNNFEKYCNSIHLDTFAKRLKKEDIKSFILTQRKNKKLKRFFNQDRIGIFIKYMPKDEHSVFMKLCVDRTDDIHQDVCVSYCAKSALIGGGGGTSNSITYNWYKHAAFEVAFPALIKLIRVESNPDERNTMLMMLVGKTKNKLTHILTLLQYYRERHINEPFRFKVQFVNELLQKTDSHIYNDELWCILDELFRSMEVYIESENNVQTCIKAVIAYKVIHDETIHFMIEKNFEFDVLKLYERKLKGAQRDKLFTYLYNLFLTKLDEHVITHQTEFGAYVEFLKKGLDLLSIWKKDLVNYPFLISKIKECIKIKKEKKWTTSLATLYDSKTSWKKILFEDSLVLSPSEIVCMNALKHGPELLVRHQDEVDSLRYNDAISMQKVLQKLRIYWPQTLASNWTASYRERLDRPGGHKALVRGLCCLLNQHELIEFLKKYEPQETKINWVDGDELQLSLRKSIAQTMHIARPQVSPDAVLWYAKGDYVQFTQPSLNSILHNLRPSHSRDCVLKLLNSTVSLQKHGIHLAFAKLSTSDMKQLFEHVWKTTKNSSVRAVLFQNTNDMMCKEHDEVLIAEAWELLQTFIDSLSAEENNAIYNTFGKLATVHNSIKPDYCLTSYKFLKSLPPEVDCKNILQKIKEEMGNITEKLDSDFIASVIEEFTNEVMIKKSCDWSNRHDVKVLTSYLLCAETETDQTERFNKVFVPLMEKSLASWDKIDHDYLIVKQNFIEIIEELIKSTTDYSFLKNKAKPISIYLNILKKLEGTLPATQNFVLFRLLKLAAAIVDMLDKKKSDSISIIEKSQLQDLYSTCAPGISKIIVKYLKEDIDEYGVFIYRPFAEAATKILIFLDIHEKTQLKCLKHMLSEKDFLPIYLLVIKMDLCYLNEDDENKPLLKEICEMIRSHQHELLEFLNKYEPQQTKINWLDGDKFQLNLRKSIAQTMHIARHQVPPDAVLCMHNLRPSHSRDCVLRLLNGMESLQKHGLHLAFAKLSTSDMKQLFEDVWKTTKNSSVRAVLFQNTNDMLYKEHDEVLIGEAWELLQTFIDSVSAEDRTTTTASIIYSSNALYNPFRKLAKVPNSIKAAYCSKSYKFFKSLPSYPHPVYCYGILGKMKEEMCNIIEQLDSDFIASIIEEFTNEVMIKTSCENDLYRHDVKILTSYLLCAETETDQTERFNKVFVPLMEKSLASWDKIDRDYFIVKQNFMYIIRELIKSTTDYSFLKNKAKPISLYLNILKKLEDTLPAAQNFVLFRLLKLAAAIVDMLDKKKTDSRISIDEKSQLQDQHSTCAPDISKIIVTYFKEDVDEYGSFIYGPFAEAATKILIFLDIHKITQLKCLKHMLSEKDFLPIYLLVIKMHPCYHNDESKQLLKEIREMLLSHPSPEVQKLLSEVQ